MNTATLKIAIEVDDKGSVKLRQVGKDAADAGAAGAKGFDRMDASAASAQKSTSLVSATVKSMVSVVAALATGIGAVKLAKMAEDAALAYARYETMGAAMVTVGNNAGYTASQMAEYEKKLRSTGIAMTESRETLTKMAASHIDLAKATDLARIAQDAAVVGNINSSEAFDRMINGIRSAEVEVLRGIGLNVNFEESYKKLGAQLGKNAQDLTETEKTQARVNVVVAAGVGIAGTYEAAMGTTGKMINSMKRYLDDLEVSLGEAFSPALKLLVDQMTVALKDANGEVANGRTDIQNWGREFALTIIDIEKALIRLSQFIDRVGGTMTTMLTTAGRLYDIGANIGGAVSDMFSGSDSGWTESAATQAGERWNKMYAERSAAAEKMYAELEQKESRLKNSELTGVSTLEQARTKASEQLRIKKGLEARAAQEAGDKEAGAMKDAEAAHKKAEAAAKKHADELQRLIDKYLPMRGAAETAAEAESGLAELRKQGALSAEEYALALQHVREAHYAEIEAATHAMELQTQLADAYHDVTMALMTDQERKVYDIEDANSKLMAQIDLLQRENKITADVANTWRTHLGEKMAQDIQAVNEEASQSVKLFEDLAKNIQSAFADMFENLIDGTGNMLDDLGTLFKKLLAQMATMAIAQPIIVPIVYSMGSAMGVSDNTIAKSLGMDVSGLSGGGTSLTGLGSLGGLFNNGATIGTTLGGWLTSAGTSIGLADDSLVFSSANYLSNLGTLGNGLLAGGGSLLLSALTGNLNTQSVFQAGGAALGSYFGPVGSVVGGLLGSLVGGLFGDDDENEFGFDSGVIKALSSKFSTTSGLSVTNPHWTPFNETGVWYDPIINAYSDQISAIQTSFNKQVFDFAEQLPAEVQQSMLANLAATNFRGILASASAGKWVVSDAEDAIKGAASAYSTGLLKALGKAYASALSDYITTKGPGELVGDPAVWALLTSEIQDKITDLYTSAATTISAGDITSGLSAISEANTAIAQITSAMQPITEILDTNGLTAYEQSIRSINQQFDDYAAALKAAGVDMEKYADLEAARAIALGNAAEALAASIASVIDPIDDILATSSLSDYEQALRAINEQFDGYRDQLDELGAALSNYTSLEQARYLQLTAAADDYFDAITGKFDSALEKLSPATASAGTARAQLAAILEQARGGDFASIGSLSDIASAIAGGDSGGYGSLLDYQRSIWGSYAMVQEIERLAKAAIVPQYADGGIHAGGWRIVGESGPELEYTGPSRIYSNSDSKALVDTSGLAAEVRELRHTLERALFQVAKNTGQTTEQLKRWEYNGMPPVRAV